MAYFKQQILTRGQQGMIIYMGSHYSEREFPILPGKQSKYKTSTYMDLEFNFGDVIYHLPEMVMHYLDDADSIGWSWVPPKDFIDRVMKGGVIKFNATRQEKVRTHVECIGYLCKGTGEFAGRIVDTKGGDANYQNARPVELGQAPALFIERMKQMTLLACNETPLPIELETAPGYENVVIPVVPPNRICYENHINELMCLELERKGLKPCLSQLSCIFYLIIKSLPFYSLEKEVAVANVELSGNYILGLFKRMHDSTIDEMYHKLKQAIPGMFAPLSVEFDKDCEFPLLKVSGKNLERLKAINLEPIEIDERVSLKEKIFAVLGFQIEKCNIEKHKVEIHFQNSSFGNRALEDFMERNKLIKEDVSYRKDTLNSPIIFEQLTHKDQYSLGAEFCMLIENEYKNHFAYKLKNSLLTDKKLHRDTSAFVASITSVIGSADKKSGPRVTEQAKSEVLFRYVV
ncbi:MAG: hypothetical protein ACYCQI_08935 [Gammaproteobacteria bacterium]